jgi:hypothetical protein
VDAVSAIRACLVVALLGMVGCIPESRYGEPETATIVAVPCEKRSGEEDCRTVVQFADGRRAVRPGAWGAVGDALMARRNLDYSSSEYWGWTP